MYDDDLNAPPFNPLPGVIILLACLVGGIELVFQLAEAGFIGGPRAIGWRVAAVQQFAFSDQVFDWMRMNGIYTAHNMVRFISYSFIHQSLMHAVFALVFILAIGKFVAEIMHPLAVLFIFLASAAISAFVYSVLLDDHTMLMGAFPAIYGLLGAYTWLQVTKLTSEGENGLRAFSLVFALLAITLVFLLISWLLQSARLGGIGIWLTQLIGFVVGFLLSVVLAPDGRHRVQTALRRIRHR